MLDPTGLSGAYLKLDQTSPQTTVGTFTFPIVKFKDYFTIASQAQPSGNRSIFWFSGNTEGFSCYNTKLDNSGMAFFAENYSPTGTAIQGYNRYGGQAGWFWQQGGAESNASALSISRTSKEIGKDLTGAMLSIYDGTNTVSGFTGLMTSWYVYDTQVASMNK